MTDWDEIKRLAADFQRTQTSDTLQRLSERNCIDIVKKLGELNLIELIYTCDGKEFVTPTHLIREIEDEIYVNGGRMSLHDLAAKTRVDYQHVENKSKELARTRPNEYTLILGQLIHSFYKDTLSKQINDYMWLNGQLSVADFAKSLDLPSEFLLDIINELVSTSSLIMSSISPDGQTFYTADMMDKYRSTIVGSLTAIMRPITIASLIKRLTIPEKIFLPIVESLIKEGRIDASVENRQFIPSIYAREQNDYINKFYQSNSYIEYDLLLRMDIKQPKTFLKKRFPDGLQLKTCFVNPSLLAQVESMIDETISSNGWIDTSTILPSAIESDDIKDMLAIIFKKSKSFQTSSHIFDDTYVCSNGHIRICGDSFQKLMLPRAHEDLKSGRLIEFFMVGKSKDKEISKAEDPEKGRERTISISSSDEETTRGRKPKGRKSGGGAGSQGREYKQKSVKKKYFVSSRTPHKQVAQSDTTTSSPPEPLVLMETDEMLDKLRLDCSEDCSDEFLKSILKLIQEDINRAYRQLARQVLDEFLKAQEEGEKEKGEETNVSVEAQANDEKNDKDEGGHQDEQPIV